MWSRAFFCLNMVSIVCPGTALTRNCAADPSVVTAAGGGTERRSIELKHAGVPAGTHCQGVKLFQQVYQECADASDKDVSIVDKATHFSG